MRLSVLSAKVAPMPIHYKVDKPDPNGNRQQRRAAKKMMMKGKKK